MNSEVNRSSSGKTTAEILESPEWKAFAEQADKELSDARREANKFRWSDLIRSIGSVLRFIAFYVSIPIGIGLVYLLIQWGDAWTAFSYVVVAALGFIVGRFGYRDMWP